MKTDDGNGKFFFLVIVGVTVPCLETYKYLHLFYYSQTKNGILYLIDTF